MVIHTAICPLFYASIIGPRLYDEQKLGHVPWDMLQVSDRNEMKQLPDWVRRALDLGERSRKGNETRVFGEMEFALNEILERLVAGSSRDLQSRVTLKTPVLVAIANKMQTSCKNLCKQEDVKGQGCRIKKIDSRWMSRWLNRWQWSVQNSNSKCAYLPDATSELQDTRKAHQARRLAHNVSWPLVLNIEQMWRTAYEPPDQAKNKHKDKESCRLDDAERFQAISKIVEGDLAKRLAHGSDRPSKVHKTCARLGGS